MKKETQALETRSPKEIFLTAYPWGCSYNNAVFDERFDLLPEHQQKIIRMFFGSGCYSVAEAIVLWMNSMDCSAGAREMILDYQNEYDKLMDKYEKEENKETA
jgi:hypothetical protein